MTRGDSQARYESPLTQTPRTAKKVRANEAKHERQRLYESIQSEASVSIYILTLALSWVLSARMYSRHYNLLVGKLVSSWSLAVVKSKVSTRDSIMNAVQYLRNTGSQQNLWTLSLTILRFPYMMQSHIQAVKSRLNWAIHFPACIAWLSEAKDFLLNFFQIFPKYIRFSSNFSLNFTSNFLKFPTMKLNFIKNCLHFRSFLKTAYF